MNDAILSKLKKLLNLSKSSNIAEAELALTKATEIATNAGIDLAIVAVSNTDTEAEKLELVEDTIKCGARLPSLQKYASWLLQKHFGVQVLYSGSRHRGKEVALLGDKKDVEFGKFVNSFVQEDMQRRWEYYKKSHSLSVKYKQTFMYNCYKGFDQKLFDAKLATETVRFATMEKGQRDAVADKYALVVSNKADAVEAFKNKKYPRLTRAVVSLGNTNASASVASAARAIGASMTINRPLSC